MTFFGEDSAVNVFEAMDTVMFGKEAALYCMTGTMSHQVAIKCRTQPGDEVICERFDRICIYECGFFDQSHFIRTFKQLTGMLPAHYQKL